MRKTLIETTPKDNEIVANMLKTKPGLPQDIINKIQSTPIPQNTTITSNTVLVSAQTQTVVEEPLILKPATLKLGRSKSLNNLADVVQEHGVLISPNTIQKVAKMGSASAQALGMEQIEIPIADEVFQDLTRRVELAEKAKIESQKALETNYTRRLLTAFGLTTAAVGGAFAYGFLVRSGAIAPAPVTIEETKTITIFGKEVIKLVTQIKK